MEKKSASKLGDHRTVERVLYCESVRVRGVRAQADNRWDGYTNCDGGAQPTENELQRGKPGGLFTD